MGSETDIRHGSEKEVRFVGDEVWALNRTPLNPKVPEKTREWIEASHLLGEIVYALLPRAVAQPLGLEFTVRDTLDGIQRNALRRSKYVRGKEWYDIDEEKREELQKKFSESLEKLGIDRIYSFDGNRINFLYPNEETAIYVDSFEPLTPITDTEYDPTVDSIQLGRSIVHSHLSDEEKKRLLKKLILFQKLTGKLMSGK